MKFNRLLLSCFFVLTFLSASFAQLVNCNPDPNGPVYIGGDAISSPFESISCQTMVQNPLSVQLTLPSSVNNSELIYFPYIGYQYSGSCVHFAEIWYTFTYEINRIRGLNAGDVSSDEFKCNRYHPHFTYNFVNDGVNKGTQLKSGFGTIVDNGIPSLDQYEDPALNHWSSRNIYWMSGF